MCAWLRTTASMDSGRKGKSTSMRPRRLPRREVPQSRRMRSPPASTRCMEPVTLCAAPRKVKVGFETPRAGCIIILTLYRLRPQPAQLVELLADVRRAHQCFTDQHGVDAALLKPLDVGTI